jgi:ATP-dependent DNA ligase
VPLIHRISREVKNIIPFRVRPMLATLVSEPFDESGWVYEEKYDGIRILAYKEGSKVTLLSRNDKDRTASDIEEAALKIGSRYSVEGIAGN